MQRLWTLLATTLTTPPLRRDREPLILPEQSNYHLLLESVPKSIAAEIEAHPELYPGLRIRITTHRRYPQQTLAAHLVGFRQATRPSRPLAGLSAAIPTGSIPTTTGQTGLEQTYDAVLRGRPGLRQVVRNHRGEVLRTEILRAPQAGRDVVITLDAGLQRRVEGLLDAGLTQSPASERADGPRAGLFESDPGSGTPALQPNPHTPRGGCIVVLDVQTGSILAAASAPRFDVNVLSGDDPEEWRRLTNDPRRPFFPRIHRMTLPPGSVFKPVSAVALLEDGTVNPDEPFHCRGYLDRPDSHRCYIYRHYGVGHGDLTLSDALCRSCNVYFFNAARRMGPRPLVRWARRLGFGVPTGIDLPGELPGHLPSPFSTASRGSGSRSPAWYPGDTLGLAIGQSRLTVTPLQIVRMMAAIANGGYLVTPHLLRRVDVAAHTPDWVVSGPPLARRRIPGLRESTLQRIREGLWRVVQDPRGTGYKSVRLEGVEIAGKTGTAEVGPGKADHAWFAGYVPAENPRVAFVVVLEHGGSGGKHAGPLAKSLVKLLIERGVIPARHVGRSEAR